jgi:hypothetical protein
MQADERNIPVKGHSYYNYAHYFMNRVPLCGRDSQELMGIHHSGDRNCSINIMANSNQYLAVK